MITKSGKLLSGLKEALRTIRRMRISTKDKRWVKVKSKFRLGGRLNRN